MKFSELEKKYPTKTFGVVNVKMGYHDDPNCETKWGYASESNVPEGYKVGEMVPYYLCKCEKGNHEIVLERMEIYLDHSCDEWVIGSKADAESMIFNLQEAVNYIDSFILP